jgi:hypothetical protein
MWATYHALHLIGRSAAHAARDLCVGRKRVQPEREKGVQPEGKREDGLDGAIAKLVRELLVEWVHALLLHTCPTHVYHSESHHSPLICTPLSPPPHTCPHPFHAYPSLTLLHMTLVHSFVLVDFSLSMHVLILLSCKPLSCTPLSSPHPLNLVSHLSVTLLNR